MATTKKSSSSSASRRGSAKGNAGAAKKQRKSNPNALRASSLGHRVGTTGGPPAKAPSGRATAKALQDWTAGKRLLRCVWPKSSPRDWLVFVADPDAPEILTGIEEVRALVGLVEQVSDAELRRMIQRLPTADCGLAHADPRRFNRRIGRDFEVQPVEVAVVHDALTQAIYAEAYVGQWGEVRASDEYGIDRGPMAFRMAQAWARYWAQEVADGPWD